MERRQKFVTQHKSEQRNGRRKFKFISDNAAKSSLEVRSNFKELFFFDFVSFLSRFFRRNISATQSETTNDGKHFLEKSTINFGQKYSSRSENEQLVRLKSQSLFEQSSIKQIRELARRFCLLTQLIDYLFYNQNETAISLFIKIIRSKSSDYRVEKLFNNEIRFHFSE